MYNVKGSSKIVAKTRRSLVQNIEVKNRRSPQNGTQSTVDNNNHIVLNNNHEEIMVKGPKPVFQNMNKRSHYHHNGGAGANQHRHHHDYDDQQVVTPQHEEIVNYISDSWNCVCTEMDAHANSSNGSSSPRSDNSTYYYEDDPVTSLADFKPFDLESWWGKRLYAYITNSVNNNTPAMTTTSVVTTTPPSATS